jgi:hypothetical protein
MASLYSYVLQGRNQEQIFFETTKECENVNLIREDSLLVEFPKETRFCFAFLDGNHDPHYVKSDFRLAWSHLMPGGMLGFHDFEGDLPLTTEAIREILQQYNHEIESTLQVKEKWLLFLLKKND